VDHLQGKQPLILDQPKLACVKSALRGAFFLPWTAGSSLAFLASRRYIGDMTTFRDASIGVWCLSWHPSTDDVCFEPLASVIRNNLVACDGQRKGVLMLLGHRDDDMLALIDPTHDDLHGVAPRPMCQSFRIARMMGWAPAWYPVGIESAERWEWMMAEG
jgi:hypothetical protein